MGGLGCVVDGLDCVGVGGGDVGEGGLEFFGEVGGGVGVVDESGWLARCGFGSFSSPVGREGLWVGGVLDWQAPSLCCS